MKHMMLWGAVAVQDRPVSNNPQMASIDVKDEVFVQTFNHPVWPIIRLL